MTSIEDKFEGNINTYYITQEHKYTGCHVTPIFVTPQDREFFEQINNKTVKEIKYIIKSNSNIIHSEFYKKQFAKIKRSKKETLI